MEKAMAPGGLPSMGSHRVGHDWSDLAAAAVHCKREERALGAASVLSKDMEADGAAHLNNCQLFKMHDIVTNCEWQTLYFQLVFLCSK